MDSMLNDLDRVTAWLDSATKKEVADMIRRLFEYASPEELAALSCLAREQVEQYYGRAVYFRGLIEFSSYCRNDCFYCGLRKNNPHATRYRLSKQEIVACCAEGRALGFRTFVLQSGEDEHFDDDRLCGIVSTIATRFPDCAVTLSVGERPRSSYLRLFESGAARYLLRHETADENHYALLHPPELSLRNRKKCLIDLKEIGFQVGAGFMVDAPHQTYDSLAEDFPTFLLPKSPRTNLFAIGVECIFSIAITNAPFPEPFPEMSLFRPPCETPRHFPPRIHRRLSANRRDRRAKSREQTPSREDDSKEERASPPLPRRRRSCRRTGCTLFCGLSATD